MEDYLDKPQTGITFDPPVPVANTATPRLGHGLIRWITAKPEVKSSNPHEQKAYEHGLGYVKPTLSPQATTIGAYVRDIAPTDFEDHTNQRKVADTVQEETIKCSVSGHFIDSSIFSDTNVILEILQNAEPKDSKGTWFDMQFYAKGKWYPIVGNIENFADSEIEGLRIIDNGKGYMPKDMTTLGGGKRQDKEAAGRFGSGMKISDRSALGSKVEVVRYSRNWRAKPYLEAVTTSAGHDHTVSYNVEYIDKIHPGSVVEYTQLTIEMIQALRGIEDIYLPLDRSFEERFIAQTPHGLILRPKQEDGQIMVHGRIYTPTVVPDNPLLFSYDLQNCAIDDQNRHYVDISKVLLNMSEIWGDIEDPALFKKLFSTAANGKKFAELEMNGITTPVPQAFMTAAQEQYEIVDPQKTFIICHETNEEELKILTRKGFKGIKVSDSKFILETLYNAGIHTGRQLIDKIEEYAYTKEDAENYKDKNFPSVACRAIFAIREICGNSPNLLVQITNNETGQTEEIDYAKFKTGKLAKGLYPTAFIIRATGHQIPKGDGWYAPHWYKKFDHLSTACTASGTKASISNGGSEIYPTREYNSTKLRIFNWESLGCAASDLEVHLYVETANHVEELKNLHNYSLNLREDYKPIEETEFGDVVDLDKSIIYEQGIRKQRNKAQSVLSYNLPAKSSQDQLPSAIANILNVAKDPKIPIAILKKAKKEGSQEYFIEYRVIIHDEAVRANWAAAFKKVFGKNTALNDLKDKPHRKLSAAATESSGLTNETLHPNLSKTLEHCGVKLLSESVVAKKVHSYRPHPLKESFLQVSRIADIAIKQCLPKGIRLMLPTIELATAAFNIYGENIRTGDGYLDPTLTNKTIYVFEDVVTTRKIGELITFILNKKIDCYSDKMSEDEFLNFKSSVMATVESAITSIEFLRKIRQLIFNKKRRFAELVEVTIGKMEEVQAEPEESIDLRSDIKEIRSAIMNKLAEWAKNLEGLGDASKKLAIGTIRVATYAAIATVVVGGVGYGIKTGVSALADSQILNKPSNGEGYQRPQLSSSAPIGVSTERQTIQRTENTEGDNYAQDSLANFVTTPKLSWGYFMSEQSLTRYNGTGWEKDDNAPEFTNPQYPHQKRFAHYQKTGNAKTVELRTRAGGYIDQNSIRLIKKDGSTDLSYLVTKLPHGEVKLQILSNEIEAVLYQTANPISWQKDADKLTDADFQQLDPQAYAYYTQTADIDLIKIPFASPLFAQFTNYREFMDYVMTLKPIERITAIRSIVLKMRYTRTERTESAYRKFHNGELPEKDFMEFILSSDQIENPGDGDCDAQNTIAALLFRYAGIPAKLDFVFTEKGIGHAPASIYLPNIGWILSDTMGDRTLIERVSEEDPRLNANGNESTQEQAEKNLIEQLRRHAEYQTRECYRFQ